jgi:hypothetical protein
LGVFVRDAEDTELLLNDPTGWQAVGIGGSQTDSVVPVVTDPSFTQLPSGIAPPAWSQTPAAVDAPIGSGGTGGYFTSQLSSEPDKMSITQAPTAPSTRTSLMSGKWIYSQSSNSSDGNMSEAEKKRQELQMRVYRARTQMPGHVPLRVFRSAAECVEVEEILKREGI